MLLERRETSYGSKISVAKGICWDLEWQRSAVFIYFLRIPFFPRFPSRATCMISVVCFCKFITASPRPPHWQAHLKAVARSFFFRGLAGPFRFRPGAAWLFGSAVHRCLPPFGLPAALRWSAGRRDRGNRLRPGESRHFPFVRLLACTCIRTHSLPTSALAVVGVF